MTDLFDNDPHHRHNDIETSVENAARINWRKIEGEIADHIKSLGIHGSTGREAINTGKWGDGSVNTCLKPLRKRGILYRLPKPFSRKAARVHIHADSALEWMKRNPSYSQAFLDEDQF